LLLEVHPPVDAQGQSTAPDMAVLSKLLDQALGKSTAAIHWDFARQALQAATGIPVVVGLEADPNAPASPADEAAAPAIAASGAATAADDAAAVPAQSRAPTAAPAEPVTRTLAPVPPSSAPVTRVN